MSRLIRILYLALMIVWVPLLLQLGAPLDLALITFSGIALEVFVIKTAITTYRKEWS